MNARHRFGIENQVDEERKSICRLATAHLIIETSELCTAAGLKTGIALKHAISIYYIGVRRLKRIVGANPRFSGTNSRLIRLFDIVLAAYAFPALAGAMFIMAVIFKTQGQRMFTRIEFVGRSGETLLSYRLNAPSSGPWSIIRKSSLDQMPMILNVIQGDMSLVGPRPVERHGESETMPFVAPMVRPGLIGFINQADEEMYTTKLKAGEYFRLIWRAFVLSIAKKSHSERDRPYCAKRRESRRSD